MWHSIVVPHTVLLDDLTHKKKECDVSKLTYLRVIPMEVGDSGTSFKETVGN